MTSESNPNQPESVCEKNPTTQGTNRTVRRDPNMVYLRQLNRLYANLKYIFDRDNCGAIEYHRRLFVNWNCGSSL